MKKYIQSQTLIRVVTRVMLGVALLIGGLITSSTLALAAPSKAPGPLTGTPCSPSCDLFAVTGTMPAASLPGAPLAGVPVWGYNTSAAGVSAPGGPTLVVNEGAAVNITLHNVGIPSATSLMIAGQAIVPDSIGVIMGSTKLYAIPAGVLKAGTYLYEAGLTADGPRQVAMGLYGALIVRPTGFPLQAYAGPGTAFMDEAVLVLSEIDPAFNAAPAAFDMSGFAPKYWLINGKVYPNTDPITTDVSHTVLLRYVNAGLQHHSMSLLGLHQTIIASAGKPAAHPSRVVSETIPAGSTLDTIVTMPANAPTNANYALFDAAMHMDNTGVRTSGVINFGGMLTFLTTSTATTTPGGPVTSNVSLSPNPSSGPSGSASGPVTLSATITPSASATVTAAEYFVDTLGANGAGCAITGSLTSVSVTIPVSGASAPCADLTTLTSGSHTFYVHGQDSSGTGTWGAVSSAVLNLDKAGPAIGNLSLTPNTTNGTADVQLQATANDTANGNQNVTAAEYTLDGGAATSITVALPATVVSLNATIPAATVLGLADGNHIVAVRAQDALGNWGTLGTITLKVDKAGPTTSGVSATPNPNNGAIGVQIGTGGAFYVRVDASLSDPLNGGVNSNIAAAEYFFDAAGANGSGGAMIPTDGAFNSTFEAAYGAVDMIHIAALSVGNHTIYVHAKDAAGNWGATSSITFVIDKTPPTVSGVTLTPSASNNTAVAVSAAASDVATGNSNIGGGEFFIDTAGAAGTGTAMTPSAASPSTNINGTISGATIAALSAGNHTVIVRAKDAAGNWSTTASATLLIDRTAPTFSSITLNPNSIPSGTASVLLTVNGAADPLVGGLSSGVVGGEYWFGSTNITAGTGTAFSGLTNVPIATGSLTAGTYTVRVRIRDAAGNWSTGTNGVRTATLTVTGVAVDAIFSDGFEAGNTNAWSSRSTNTTSRLNVTAAAALVGSFGLQAQGNNSNYVQFNFGTGGNPVTGTFDARFYFRPNGNTSTGKDIFSAATSNTFGTTLFRVRYRLNGATPQVQIQVGTANTNTTWVNITGGTASNYIEVVWQAVGSGGPNPGTLVLYVNGVSSQTLTTTSTGSIGAFRMGSITTTGNATLMYFDAVSAKRSVSPLVGP